MNNWKKRFIIIWTGQLFSILSSNIAQFSIILWISLRTESAEALAFATIAGLLPQVVIGPFAGVFVDRWNRRWTMIGADSFVAICSAVMAVMFHYQIVDLWIIYLLLMLRSVGSAFHSPAMKSSITLLAPADQYTRIAGINQILQSVCMISGPALGAIMVVSLDMSVIMLIDVVGAFVACTSLLFVSIPNPDRAKKLVANLLKEMSEGLKQVTSNRPLSWIMLSEIIATFFIMPVVALFPLMTLKHFGGSAYQVGLIEVLWGVGTFFGGLLLSVWNPAIRKVSLLCGSYIAIGVAFAASGMLPPSAFIWYAVLSVAQGLAIPFYSAPLTALLQTMVEDRFQGRVFSLFDSMSLLPSLFGLLATGFLADTFGITTIFVVSGLAVIATAFGLMSIPSVSRVKV